MMPMRHDCDEYDRDEYDRDDKATMNAVATYDVRGVDLDAQTRCAHYHSPLDIIAIKMKCCGVYYACKDCHQVLAGHAMEAWPQQEWNQRAVLCGACGHDLTIAEYMASDYACPACNAAFNPGCRNHYHFYFGD
jgi:uncharacterized CHY-type Zn-finger protein